jgi:uncharacterized protein (TIGR04255 family)
MNNKMKKYPIEEILCDVRFSSSDEWDVTAFGKFYVKIERDYPEKEELEIFALPFDREGDIDNINETEILMKFIKTDKSRVIQLSKDLLTLNILTPEHQYPGWEALKPEIIEQINNYREICKPKTIESIGLRYVNKFYLSNKKKFDIEKIFKKPCYLPEIVFNNKSPFFMELVYPLENDLLAKITIGNIKQRVKNKTAIVFDIEVSTLKKNIELDNKIIDEKLEILHKNINSIFNNCISREQKEKIG